MVHATARLEVGIKQADGAEPLLLRVRHDVGAEQLQRLQRVGQRCLLSTLTPQQAQCLLETLETLGLGLGLGLWLGLG